MGITSINALLFTDRCTIREEQPVTQPGSSLTTNEWVTVLEDQPCRISFSNGSPTADQSGAPVIDYAAKVFISPDIEIPAGSEIIINRQGKTYKGKRSGDPALYPFHQELPIKVNEYG